MSTSAGHIRARLVARRVCWYAREFSVVLVFKVLCAWNLDPPIRTTVRRQLAAASRSLCFPRVGLFSRRVSSSVEREFVCFASRAMYRPFFRLRFLFPSIRALFRIGYVYRVDFIASAEMNERSASECDLSFFVVVFTRVTFELFSSESNSGYFKFFSA